MTNRTAQISALWPVLVVSLPDAIERRRRIEDQLSRLSIRYQFIDAVDGRAGLPQEFEAMIDRPRTETSLGRKMADAEYACALSHISIYRRIVSEDLPGAIILEDDAIVGTMFAQFCQTRGYDLADLIQLDHLHGAVWKFSGQIRLTDTVRLVKAARNASLTTGYSISSRGAAHILEHGLPLRAPADWPCDVTVLPAMLALPCVVDHPDVAANDSSIEADRAAITSASFKVVRSLRFFNMGYWRRWWFKRRTKRVS